MISITGLSKTYADGFEALKNVDLEINRGEIFALLGPNGAGKTTLINIVCGIVNASAGEVLVDGYDITHEFRKTRSRIGLVPQELPTEAFETVLNTVRFSRGLFGKSADPEHLEKVLKSLSLWDKKDTIGTALSGGMKRRVLIAKALAHEPEVLFIDEPTAGVDVELRQDMWNVVKALRDARGTGLTHEELIEATGNPRAVAVLKGLAGDDDWADAIHLANSRNARYRLRWYRISPDWCRHRESATVDSSDLVT